MTKWQWAALWKRAAKEKRHEADRYFMAWIRAVVQLGWRGQQARAWKRAAKNYRAMFKLCALTSVPLWKERYWASQRSAKAWKATAKKWRRQTLLLEYNNESMRAAAEEIHYL